MLTRLRGRLTYANVVATLALFVALGGSSYAAVSITGKNVKNSSLTGTDIKNSSLTTKDVKNRSLLAKDFKKGQLPAGKQGAQGLQGLKGDKGDAATRLWAKVNTSGGLIAGSGVTATSRSQDGRFIVTFDRDVSGCAWSSTPTFATGPAFGVTSNNNRTGDPKQVAVLTAVDTNATVDEPFDLAVFC